MTQEQLVFSDEAAVAIKMEMAENDSTLRRLAINWNCDILSSGGEAI